VIDADEADYRGRLQHALGGDYELRELIGRGGFGAVYAAWDRRLERELAVKALRHDLFPTRLVLERFQREAKAVAKLRHPNILPVYSVGEGEGLAFMIMPLIRGESLSMVLKSRGKLPPEEAIRIATEVARALDVAHRLGIIHRDVKPENILLDGDERHALLADFGIAKAMESDDQITHTGMIVGSPQYMSPEHAAGERDLDARSDIYSLGAVTYEMLAGRRPYEAANFQQLIAQQYTTEPPQLARLVPELSPAVCDTVMRSLARERADRWTSAGEFATVLLAAGRPEHRSAPSEGRTRASWLERRGPLVMLLGLLIYYLEVVASLLTGGGRSGSLVRTLARPVVILFVIGIALLVGEMLWGMASARGDGRPWKAVLRGALGQPRWWQAWYPRALRDPANIWDRMSPAVKVLRTILWVELAALPLVGSLMFIVPTMIPIWAGSNFQLPFPIRVTIAVSAALKLPAMVGLAIVLGGVALLSARKRIPVVAVLRSLLTWRSDRWNSAEARRLLKTP
jgi:tRNA A-37 threonylcarbamoyl transferase component Bud32